MNVSLSAVVITKNEEQNIAACLSSLSAFDQVIVVDSGSTDQTIPIAQSYPNVELIQTEWLGYSDTKQLGFDQAKNNWVLWIDADEALNEDLKKFFNEFTPSEDYDVFSIQRITYFLGEPVYHCGWTDSIPRFFRKDKVRMNGKVLHEGLTYEKSRLGTAKGALNHYSYTSLYQYFDKMNRYGRYGAEQLLLKNKPVSLPYIFINVCSTFMKFYFFEKGFLDGSKGFFIAVGSAFSNFIKYTNYYYLKKQQANRN